MRFISCGGQGKDAVVLAGYCPGDLQHEKRGSYVTERYYDGIKAFSETDLPEAGNDPNVLGLVHIAAFASDKDESVATLIKDRPPSTPVPPILPPQDGQESSVRP